MAATCSRDVAEIRSGEAALQAVQEGPWRPEEAADYIAKLTEELAGIARGVQLDLVAYLLDIARLEATRTAEGFTPGGG